MKALLSFIMAVVSLWVVYLATACNMTGPRNIVFFLAGFSALCFLPLLHMIAEKKNSKDERPYWLRVVITVMDVTEIVILIWFGWWWCGAAYACGAIAGASMRFQGINEQKPEAELP